MSRKSLLDECSDEELTLIVKRSQSYYQCLTTIGYNGCSGGVYNTLKQRVKKLGLNTNHFISVRVAKRTPESVFCKKSPVTPSYIRKIILKEKFFPYVCSICGQEPFWNGKPMDLILDHINGDNVDCELENLRWVCPNCYRQLPPLSHGGRPSLRKSEYKEEHYYCPICGKEKSKNGKYCFSCRSRMKQEDSKARVSDIVSREELKSLIRRQTFSSIGRKYDVPGGTVYRWCKKYDLPYVRKKINGYTDEEWKNI